MSNKKEEVKKDEKKKAKKAVDEAKDWGMYGKGKIVQNKNSGKISLHGENK